MKDAKYVMPLVNIKSGEEIYLLHFCRSSDDGDTIIFLTHAESEEILAECFALEPNDEESVRDVIFPLIQVLMGK
jgi:hypothetical protein